MKLGEWKTNIEGINSTTIPHILQYHAAATEYASKSYKVIIFSFIFLENKSKLWVNRDFIFAGRKLWRHLFLKASQNVFVGKNFFLIQICHGFCGFSFDRKPKFCVLEQDEMIRSFYTVRLRPGRLLHF